MPSRTTALVLHCPVDSSQPPVHVFPPGPEHCTGVPTHLPLVHWSLVVQLSPSEQAAPSGFPWQPLAGVGEVGGAGEAEGGRSGLVGEGGGGDCSGGEEGGALGLGDAGGLGGGLGVAVGTCKFRVIHHDRNTLVLYGNVLAVLSWHTC